jgi:hypothetical protein
MAVTVSLSVTPAAPASGSTLTAVYSVAGNVATSAVVKGTAKIGTGLVDVTNTITLPAESESFEAPTCAGLTFTQSAADATGATWTALVP